MEYLLGKWDKIREYLKGRYIFIFLDYDGTLSPIVEAPDKAVIPQQVKDTLKGLSIKKACKVAVISGRSLSDIKERIGIREIVYSGNHGLEVESPKIKYHPEITEENRKVLGRIRTQLRKSLKA